MGVMMRRRDFLRASGAGVWIAASTGPARALTPDEKLNVAVIGVGGRGAKDLAGVGGENVVALCDVDDRRLRKAAQLHPRARTYNDYRRMLDKSADIDAVVVATPDHHHAPASAAALRLGKHVYCEKPLTHEVHEARVVSRLAARSGTVTQMGNQGHSTERIIRPVELVKAGVLGDVTDVHCWSAKVFSPGDRPRETPPVPEHLHWDLWLGPAPARPYHPKYAPFQWRGWWDFGCGNLGDMACHIMDPAFWALDLERPLTVEVEGPKPHPESAPPWRIARWTFGARGKMPPVRLAWYNARQPDADVAEGVKLPRQGSILVGTKGKMFLTHGGGYALRPEKRFANLEEPPRSIRRPSGGDHHRDWLDAIRAGRRAGSPFEYGALMTETALLANVAYRSGKRLEWDAAGMKASNYPEADRFVRRDYRKGWTL